MHTKLMLFLILTALGYSTVVRSFPIENFFHYKFSVPDPSGSENTERETDMNIFRKEVKANCTHECKEQRQVSWTGRVQLPKQGSINSKNAYPEEEYSCFCSHVQSSNNRETISNSTEARKVCPLRCKRETNNKTGEKDLRSTGHWWSLYDKLKREFFSICQCEKPLIHDEL